MLFAWLICTLGQVSALFDNVKGKLPRPRIDTSASSGNLPDISTLCPYSRFCQSSPLKETDNPDLISCCETCSCDAKCYEIGNCCHDNPLRNGNIRYPCTKVSKGYVSSLWYHVINDCKDQASILKYPQCFNPTDLNDLIIVSDPQNGRVYKNRHCAICNDVNNFESWNLQVSCDELFEKSFRTLEERDSFIFENRHNCFVHSVPPANSKSDISRCHPPNSIITERCNTTLEWNHYDKSIEDACHNEGHNQNLLFYDTSNETTVIYANVYCYLCNKPLNAKKTDLCSLADIKSYRSFPRFSALLAVDTPIIDMHVRHCDTDEIWDPYSSTCRLLSCPGGTFPDHGQCKSFIQFSEDYIVQLLFKVAIENRDNQLSYPKLLDFLDKKVTEVFDIECGFADRQLQMNFNVVLLRVNVFSKRQCSVESILTKVRELAMNESMSLMYILGENDAISVSLRLIDGYQFEFVSNNLAFKQGERSGHTVRLIDLSILNYCPSVYLSRSEILSIELTNRTDISRLGVQSGEPTNDSLAICIDTYFELRKEIIGEPTSKAYIHNMRHVIYVLMILTIARFTDVVIFYDT